MKRAFDRLYDRIYLDMKFPPIILDLLDCPGLLRLRDVRMANNQFYAFPAFANTVPTELGEYKDWTAYYYTEGKNIVCCWR